MDKNKILSKYSVEMIEDLVITHELNHTELEIKFTINEKPIPYARARAGRNGFYNPKQKDEQRYKQLFKHQLTEDQYKILKEVMSNEDSEYYVEVSGDFYVPIPTSDSMKNAVLKETKAVRPAIRNGDIDNYLKFILDSLHDVIYTDDKRVVSVSGRKYYSFDPRSEITVKIDIY